MIQSLRFPEKRESLRARFESICQSGYYTEGDWTAIAQEQVSRQVRKPVVLMNSCGSALYTMYRWYALYGHTQVAVSNNTFYATGAMAREAGLIPVLVDMRWDSPSMSVDSLREVVARDGSIKLVCLTHVGGQLAKDYDLIAQYCRERRITLVEDCAHVFGVPGAGIHGEVACWSFYATKAVPIGEGGALSAFGRPYEFAALFANYGKWPDEGVMHYTQGMNFRMSEWSAAVLSTQMDWLDTILLRRAADAEVLQSIAPCLLSNRYTNWYKYPVAREHARGLKRAGSVYARSDQLDTILGGKQIVPLPNSRRWAEAHVCLPIGEGLYEGMSEAEVREALHDGSTA